MKRPRRCDVTAAATERRCCLTFQTKDIDSSKWFAMSPSTFSSFLYNRCSTAPRHSLQIERIDTEFYTEWLDNNCIIAAQRVHRFLRRSISSSPRLALCDPAAHQFMVDKHSGCLQLVSIMAECWRITASTWANRRYLWCFYYRHSWVICL